MRRTGDPGFNLLFLGRRVCAVIDCQSLCQLPSLATVRLANCDLTGILTEQLFFSNTPVLFWPRLLTLIVSGNQVGWWDCGVVGWWGGGVV